MRKIITIGIPTHDAGQSLLATLKAIYSQSAIDQVDEILLLVDGNSLKNDFRKKIVHPKLKVIIRKQRQGQSARINDIFALAKTDLLILSNDDVIWKKDVVAKVLKSYEASKSDLTAVKVVPLPLSGLIDKIIDVGNRISRIVAKMWNNGDNYLSCNGRLLVLSKRFYKSIRIPQKLWNNDAYLYFRVKTKGYIFTFLDTTCAYFKLPKILADHFNQSAKFSYSQQENQEYFKKPLGGFYAIPLSLQLLAICKLFVKNPVYTLLYFMLLVRIRMSKFHLTGEGYWQTDKSTKILTSYE